MFNHTVKFLVILLVPSMIYAADTLTSIKEDLWSNGIFEVNKEATPSTGEVVPVVNDKKVEDKKIANALTIPEELIRSMKQF